MEVMCMVHGELAPKAASPPCFCGAPPHPRDKTGEDGAEPSLRAAPTFHTVAGGGGGLPGATAGQVTLTAPSGEPGRAEAARAGVHSLPPLCHSNPTVTGGDQRGLG